MKRTSLSCLLLGCLLFHGQANAAVMELDWKTPGDGLLTLDTLTQRQWLDLTETQLFKFPGNTLEERYQAVLAETLPGGMFAGFTPAMSDDVVALAQSAGIDTSTLSYTTNETAAGNLIDLIGLTGGLPNDNRGSRGFVTDLDPSIYSVQLEIGVGRNDAAAGLRIVSFFNSKNGVWLYRTVPEPSTACLIGWWIIAMVHYRPRRSM